MKNVHDVDMNVKELHVIKQRDVLPKQHESYVKLKIQRIRKSNYNFKSFDFITQLLHNNYLTSKRLTTLKNVLPQNCYSIYKFFNFLTDVCQASAKSLVSSLLVFIQWPRPDESSTLYDLTTPSREMALSLEKIKPSIREYVENLGACWRCAIRFTLERDPNAYVKKTTEVRLLHPLFVLFHQYV